MKKETPLWFLFLVICLITYGVISIILFSIADINLWIVVSKINIFITLFWMIFNIFMLFIFLKKGYEKEAIIFSSYYIIINLLNSFNLYFQWISTYETLRNLSIATKVFEISAVMYILLKRD
jgi:hypothetical protein